MMSFDYQNNYGIPLKHVKNRCPMRNKLLMKKTTLLMFNAYTTQVNSDGDSVILNVSVDRMWKVVFSKTFRITSLFRHIYFPTLNIRCYVKCVRLKQKWQIRKTILHCWTQASLYDQCWRSYISETCSRGTWTNIQS